MSQTLGQVCIFPILSMSIFIFIYTEDPHLDQGQPSATTNNCDKGLVSHVSDSEAGLYLSNPEHEYIYIYITYQLQV